MAKNKGGRPTKYKKEYAEQVYKLCLLGSTDEDLADFFEVDVATVNRWKLKHKEFCESLKRGKLIADADVVVSLNKRANGYQYIETTIERVFNKESMEYEEVITKKVTKEHAPDTGACMAWLKNRQPEKWRDKKDVEGNLNLNVISEVFQEILDESEEK